MPSCAVQAVCVNWLIDFCGSSAHAGAAAVQATASDAQNSARKGAPPRRQIPSPLAAPGISLRDYHAA